MAMETLRIEMIITSSPAAIAVLIRVGGPKLAGAGGTKQDTMPAQVAKQDGVDEKAIHALVEEEVGEA
jgi:hypothetical protein